MKYTKCLFILPPALAALALSLTANIAIAATALQSGIAVGLNLPGTSFFSNYYLDVDSSAQKIAVNIAGSGGDTDLFLRFGSPFPEQSSTATYPTVSEDLLNRYAHYHSVSAGSVESIVVVPSSRVPVQAGRWYITVINSSTLSATGTLTATASASVPLATITLDFGNPSTNSDPTLACDDSFWTDPAAATPAGGNNGTTLGQQRKNAVTYAANQLAQQLQIPVPITVHACGAHLGGDSTSAILAHAAPLSYFFDEPAFPIASLPKKYTWYSGTVGIRLAGTSLCGLAGGACSGVDNEEIEATFNMDIGTPAVLNGEKFYLGYDPSQKPGNTVDFISTAMHEMTHGLGFFGLANTDSTMGPVGAKAGIVVNTSSNSAAIAYQNLTAGPFDDIYDDSVAIVDNTTYTPFMGYEVNGSGDAARAAALVSGATVTQPGTYIPGLICLPYTGPCTGLRWSDLVAANSSVNDNVGRAAPNNFPSLYAPCDESKTVTCSTQPSSTLSHTVQAGDLMNAYASNTNLRNMGLAVPMLAPGGWSNAATTMPVFGQPIPSNWYDRAHSGHGFDFQLFAHDPLYRQDVYLLTFYTYQSDGTPEWYQTPGSLVDGVFLPGIDPNGDTLYRVVYQTTPTAITSYSLDPNAHGSVVVDFNQAANSSACRNLDRSDSPLLGVMSWTINGDSGTWCVEPIVPLAAHASPDFNGHWYAPSDSGWGFELLDVNMGSGGDPSVFVYVYYPGPNNQPAWATASGTLTNGSVTMQLLQVSNGYCRTCPPVALTAPSIGTMTLSLQAPASSGERSTGTATILANYPGGGGFNRTNIPIQMLSLPTGQ